MAKDPIIEEALAHTPNRRKLLRKLAVAGAAAGAAVSTGGLPLNAQATPSASDVVQFALNLEYLEAEFYSIATSGQNLQQRGVPIAGMGNSGPTTTAYGQVNFGNNLVLTSGSARDIADDEIAHVIALRTALSNNGVMPIAKPAINLDALATAGASLANQQAFLILARIFEDIGVSAYGGGASFLANSPYLTSAARILAVEGEHASNIRLQIARLGISTSAIDGADVPPPPSGGNFYSTNKANGLSAIRTPGQVLYLAYGMSAGVMAGGFFPAGVNGAINMSTAAATAANLS